MGMNPKDKIVISVLINSIADAVESDVNDLNSYDMNSIIQTHLDHENDYEVDELYEDYVSQLGRDI